MAWFHPKTLLDKTYEIGIFIKGFDGLVELIAGLFLLIVQPATIGHWTHSIAQAELGEDHGFIATHVVHYGESLSHGRNAFAITFLLLHGIIKVALVAALLRNKPWAYPFAIVALGLFIAYQAYELVVKPTFGMAFLTVLDALIIWLVWREWNQVKASAAPIA